jgi:hypothetical protein
MMFSASLRTGTTIEIASVPSGSALSEKGKSMLVGSDELPREGAGLPDA